MCPTHFDVVSNFTTLNFSTIKVKWLLHTSLYIWGIGTNESPGAGAPHNKLM